MVPINVKHANKSFDSDNLKEYIVNLCKQHKSDNKALAFAFILYDFENFTIEKILKDSNYWSTLDKISGNYLSIFYINSQDSYYHKRQKQIFEEENRKIRESSRNGHLSYFIPVTLHPTPLDNAINFIKKEFELDEDLRLPSILFFQVEDDNIIDSFMINLRENKLEDAFLELRGIIKMAIDSIKSVTKENYGNNKEIFNLLKTGVKNSLFNEKINKKITSKIGIGTIFSFTKILFGINTK